MSEYCRCFSPNACMTQLRCASTHRRLADDQTGHREMSEAAYVLLRLHGSDFIVPGAVHIPRPGEKSDA